MIRLRGHDKGSVEFLSTFFFFTMVIIIITVVTCFRTYLVICDRLKAGLHFLALRPMQPLSSVN